jgi:putative ABC transport system ATP-binding protein
MLVAHNIKKTFSSDNKDIPVLNGISLNLKDGDFTSIVGRSGSGKTTLLNVLSTLVRPDRGELTYHGRNLTTAPESQLDQLRRSDFAVIFQFHHLLPYLTVLENTLLPFMSNLKPVGRKMEKKALECLDRVGIADKARRLPGNLSGGEQQRVAIARALVKSAKILFADEPTGSLDKATGETIMELLVGLNGEGLSIIMVTHETEYAALAGRTIEIEDGSLVQ